MHMADLTDRFIRHGNTGAIGNAAGGTIFHEHVFKHPLVSLGYMLEEFCEKNHCDQYIHSMGGSFAQCLIVQRVLSRVGTCPLRYDRIAAKLTPEIRTNPGKVKGEPRRKGGFTIRSK